MQNPLLEFIHSSIVSKKPGYLPGKSKTLTGSNYHRVFAHLSYLPMSTKRC